MKKELVKIANQIVEKIIKGKEYNTLLVCFERCAKEINNQKYVDQVRMKIIRAEDDIEIKNAPFDPRPICEESVFE